MDFLGRSREIELLRDWTRKTDGAFLTVIYGRRRIGKSRLVEEAFKGSALLKFEGIEGQPTSVQHKTFLDRLAEVTGRSEYRMLKAPGWRDILILLSEYLAARAVREPVVVLLDEVQWMAAGRTQLVSSLKYVWDNHLLKKHRIHMILCGSVGSFIVKKVIRSRALYGRVHLEMNLKPLRLPEIKGVFHPPRSLRDVAELYMTLGGVPQYLEMVDPACSVRLNLERLCFSREGYLVKELERLFASHFGTAPHYRTILKALSNISPASREDLQRACKLRSGGRISEYLEDLELAGFIEGIGPVHRIGAERNLQYRIVDPYLLFYFRFIRPSLRRIEQAQRPPAFSSFVPERRYTAWRALAFERLCYEHAPLIAEKLGFGAVHYEYGPWFSRGPKACQIDLLFLRADRTVTLCEIKFQEASVGKEVIAEVEKKRTAFPNKRALTIEPVLITASPPTEDLVREGYFHRILLLEQLFGP